MHAIVSTAAAICAAACLLIGPNAPAAADELGVTQSLTTQGSQPNVTRIQVRDGVTPRVLRGLLSVENAEEGLVRAASGALRAARGRAGRLEGFELYPQAFGGDVPVALRGTSTKPLGKAVAAVLEASYVDFAARLRPGDPPDRHRSPLRRAGVRGQGRGQRDALRLAGAAQGPTDRHPEPGAVQPVDRVGAASG